MKRENVDSEKLNDERLYNVCGTLINIGAYVCGGGGKFSDFSFRDFRRFCRRFRFPERTFVLFHTIEPDSIPGIIIIILYT